jgi:hypothetical protein
MGVDRNEIKEQGKYKKVLYWILLRFNLYETYYHPSTVVEKWNIMFILLLKQ